MPRFEINIAYAGKHYAKAVLAAETEALAKHQLEEFRRRFPEDQSWHLTLTRWDSFGTHINA